MQKKETGILIKPLTVGLIPSLLKEGILIRDLKNVQPVKQALGYCFALTGLKEVNFPKEDVEKVLIDFIITTYPGYVAEEIKEAFKQALKGTLDIKDKDVSHYQNFSAEYLSKIMKAYNKLRGQQLKKETDKVKDIVYPNRTQELPNLLLNFYRKSKDMNHYQIRPDVAVYGYELMRELGHLQITEAEMNRKYQDLKDPFLKEKRDSGAKNYHIEKNLNQYKMHVQCEVYKEFALKCMVENVDLYHLMTTNK